jgi:hypothetical protein
VSIRVEKMAKPDTFISEPLPISTKLNPFKFTITVGTNSYEIDFGGGTLYDLAKTINNVAGSAVSASVVKVDKDNEVIRISSKKTGKSNRIFIRTGEGLSVQHLARREDPEEGQSRRREGRKVAGGPAELHQLDLHQVPDADGARGRKMEQAKVS